MSLTHRVYYNDKLHFCTFTVVNWIDVFIRVTYNDEIIKALEYCRQNKGLELFAYCLMTSIFI